MKELNAEVSKAISIPMWTYITPYLLDRYDFDMEELKREALKGEGRNKIRTQNGTLSCVTPMSRFISSASDGSGSIPWMEETVKLPSDVGEIYDLYNIIEFIYTMLDVSGGFVGYNSGDCGRYSNDFVTDLWKSLKDYLTDVSWGVKCNTAATGALTLCDCIDKLKDTLDDFAVIDYNAVYWLGEYTHGLSITEENVSKYFPSGGMTCTDLFNGLQKLFEEKKYFNAFPFEYVKDYAMPVTHFYFTDMNSVSELLSVFELKLEPTISSDILSKIIMKMLRSEDFITFLTLGLFGKAVKLLRTYTEMCKDYVAGDPNIALMLDAARSDWEDSTNFF